MQIGVRSSPSQHSLVHHVYKKYIPKLRQYTIPLVSQAQVYYAVVTHRKCIAKHMINHRISAVWNTTKPIATFSCTPRLQEVPIKAEGYTFHLVSQSQRYYSIVTHRKCIAKHMINPRISADQSTTYPIAAFSCTPRVQEVHTKSDFIHLTPGLLCLGLLFNCHAQLMYCETYD